MITHYFTIFYSSNPAITIVYAWNKKFEWRRVPYYLMAQFLGAFFGALAVLVSFYNQTKFLNKGIYAVPPNANSTAQLFATYPTSFRDAKTGAKTSEYPSLMQCVFD